ncbi:POK18 protein, partial [Paradoxornis webbianus]|nr:POK18 protein [Sinosuthora webbiana]
DAPQFTFSVPSINRKAPWRRYHWKVLPQGMKNSPTICQWMRRRQLSPVRTKAGEAIIIHYMDDVLVCALDDNMLTQVLEETITALTAAGFELQQEKVQRMPPWRYLGLEISKRTITPQKLVINNRPRTLRDLQQLCGSLNWVWTWLGLTTENLALLFNLLKGGEELDSPRGLTQEAQQALEKVQLAMSSWQAHRCWPDLPFNFIILGKLPHLHGLIFHWDKDQKDPLLIIEWMFFGHQMSKSITKPQELMAQMISEAGIRMQLLVGCEFTHIHVPIKLSTGRFTNEALEQLLSENEMLQFALDSDPEKILIHCPGHKLFTSEFNLIPKEKQSHKPLKGRRSHKSVMTWKDPQTQQWETDVEIVEGSPQVAELATVVRVFERFSEPINIVTDSAYVAGVVSRAENAVLKKVSNTVIFNLLSKLIHLVSHQEQPYYIMHVRSHTDLPG